MTLHFRSTRLASLWGSYETYCVPVALSPLFFTLAAVADDDKEHHHHEDLTAAQLGTVTFPVSCAAIRAEALRERCGPAAFLLVRRSAKRIPADCRRRSALRHGALGRGHEPVAPALEQSRRPSHPARPATKFTRRKPLTAPPRRARRHTSQPSKPSTAIPRN